MAKEPSDQDVTDLQGTGTVHIWNDQETWGAHWDHDGPNESGRQLESVGLGADVDDLVAWGRDRSKRVLVYGMDGSLYWASDSRVPRDVTGGRWQDAPADARRPRGRGGPPEPTGPAYDLRPDEA